MLASHPEMQTLIALDVDPTAHEIASARLEQLKQDTKSRCRLIFARDNYVNLQAAVSATSCVLGGADGILLDLGVSSMQVSVACPDGLHFYLAASVLLRLKAGILFSCRWTQPSGVSVSAEMVLWTCVWGRRL